jgi:hypothetical protein
MRIGILAVAGFVAAEMLTALSAAADASQKARFMAACLKEGKPHVCECTYEVSVAGHTAKEIELQIAFMSGDKKRHEEIKSDPTFDYKVYNAKGASGLTKTLACVQSRKR